MRNLLLFVLFLIGLFYARRALRRMGGDGDSAAGEGSGTPSGGRREREASMPEIEQMVACAHCGLHVPESEGVRGGGEFYCSDEHRRLGARR